MGKLIIVVGATASGKDTLVNKLQSHGIKRYMSYTTRPIRDGEEEGREYHFSTPEQFDEEVANDNVVAHREYVVANGETWYYFYKKDDVDLLDSEDRCCIADVGGTAELVNYFGKANTKVIYLATPLKTCIERALTRENMDNLKVKELCRRVTSDIEDIIENPILQDLIDINIPILDNDSLYDILYDLGLYEPKYEEEWVRR